MKRIIISILLILPLFFFGCETPEAGPQQPVTPTFDVSGILLPKTAAVCKGESFSIRFIAGKGPEQGDEVRLISSGGSYSAEIRITGSGTFEFTIPDNLLSGVYKFCIVRNGKVVTVADIAITIVSDVNIVPEASATVYGVVESEGKGLGGVLVSDGFLFAKTDANGVYNLKSEKKHGYVFLIVPSGYTTLTDGVLPVFWKSLSEDASKQERVDFSLIPEQGQDNHTMLFFGDIHLANRYKDRAQFSDFTKDVSEFVKTHTDRPLYAVTLGDMAWDQFWYTNGYDLNNYLSDANSGLQGLRLYHTIGNHDHECGKAGAYPKGDFDTVVKYKKILGPTYYSHNIGKVHYIALDNIKCTNPGDGTRTYSTIVTDEQLEWLRKDLSYVSKDTPVVVTMHSQLHTNTGSKKLSGADDLIGCFNGYKVRFVTGHTHQMYNIDNMSKGYYEANSGSVCATWWWTGYYKTGIHISADGTPGGYRIMEADGNRITWRFKATGFGDDYQFRTYDRNCISITADEFAPKADETHANDFNKSALIYADKGTDNTVLINLWDWDPAWKLEVTENGTPLTVTKIETKDPLHLISYEAYRYNANTTISFAASNTRHMFSVKASSPNSTIEIKATDPYGRVYTESMKRPKVFSQYTYSK